MYLNRIELKKELLRAGIRPSIQRLAIYDFVKTTNSHPTAEFVYESLRDRLGSLSLTTVYNTLKLFVDAGLVVMLNIDNAFHCFDGNIRPHAHFRCDTCGKIYDFPMKRDYHAMVEDAEGFDVQEAQLYLKGVCKSCRCIKN